MSAPPSCDADIASVNIATSLGRAAELTVALVFAVAGGAKLYDLDSTRLALGRLLARESRPPRWILSIVAAGLALAEMVVAALLLLAPSGPAVAVATFFTVCFIGAVTGARRRGIACGCFGSLFTGISGPAELRRAVVMCCLASSACIISLLPAGSRADPISVAVSTALCSSLLVAVSLDRSTRPGIALRLALSGRAPDRGGWRRATPWARAAIIRTVRADRATVEVVAHPEIGRPAWRSARVRMGHFSNVPVASVVARVEGGALQILWRRDAPVAAIGYTRRGVVLPTSAHFGTDAAPSP